MQECQKLRGFNPCGVSQAGKYLEYRTPMEEGQAPMKSKQRAIFPSNKNCHVS